MYTIQDRVDRILKDIKKVRICFKGKPVECTSQGGGRTEMKQRGKMGVGEGEREGERRERERVLKVEQRERKSSQDYVKLNRLHEDCRAK